jgi:hypothetical protein
MHLRFVGSFDVVGGEPRSPVTVLPGIRVRRLMFRATQQVDSPRPPRHPAPTAKHASRAAERLRPGRTPLQQLSPHLGPCVLIQTVGFRNAPSSVGAGDIAPLERSQHGAHQLGSKLLATQQEPSRLPFLDPMIPLRGSVGKDVCGKVGLGPTVKGHVAARRAPGALPGLRPRKLHPDQIVEPLVDPGVVFGVERSHQPLGEVVVPEASIREHAGGHACPHARRKDRRKVLAGSSEPSVGAIHGKRIGLAAA